MLYEELVYVYEYLAKVNPGRYEPYIATILNNIGVFYDDHNKPQQAEECYLRAIETRERLAKKNPKRYEPDLVQTLRNLRILYSKTDQNKKKDEFEAKYAKFLDN